MTLELQKDNSFVKKDDEGEGNKLKKCPFCGGEAHVVGILTRWVVCDECGAELKFFKTEEEAIEAWNRRVGETE